ncbi:MAG: T9SS type A sorting domain-containing protein [Bacteroidales bacterium]|nr:T9SS type A sorting domain-containing protein [Bacteroidales bacterium]
MKKIITLLALSILIVSTAAAQPYKVTQSNYQQVQIKFTTPKPSIESVELMGQSFTGIRLNGFMSQNISGKPALPAIVKLVEMPIGEGLYYTVESMTCDTIDGGVMGINNNIVPAQPSRRKSDVSPQTLSFDSAIYSQNAFYGPTEIELEPVGIARSANLVQVTFNPIRWNPVTNQILVIKEMTVSIKMRTVDIEATENMSRLYGNPAFNMSTNIINSITAKDTRTNAPLRYTIIAHSSFRGALDNFAAWKRRKGFIVDLVYTDDSFVGDTKESIQSYLQGLYTNATATSPAPTYVLFVGDIEQVPAFYLTSNGDSHYSDLPYCCWTSGDYIPDCYYGRFSAQNLSQLTPQIDKTLMYEQYTMPDPSYLSRAVLVAGVDGGYSSDNAYKYADPAMDYAAKYYVRSDNGFTQVYYYKNNTSFSPNGVTVTGSSQNSNTAAALRNLYNGGIGWANYSAHGSETSWSDPSFTVSNVNAMTNNDKPMVAIGNCCMSNSMQETTCFGEALLRKGNNAGAVGYIGGSDYTYWTEDFYWAVGVRASSSINNTCDPSYDANNLGMYDRLFHTHNESYSDWYITLGAVLTAGNMAVQSSSSSLKEYYWQIYHLMGDPSVLPYIHGEADVITANVPGAVSVGTTSLNVTAVPYAYIGFNDGNNNLVGAAFADANGDATINFDAITNPGTYEVVITAQGYQPFFQNVNVIANGPFVNTTTVTPLATLEADGDISFDITLTNQGVNDASTLSIEFQSVDGSILIDTTGIINLGTGLQTGQSITLHNVCHGHIWGNTADQTQTTVRVIVRWGNTVNDMSISNYRFTVNAASMKMRRFSFSNNLDTNGTATLIIENINEGHAELQSGDINLICLDPNLLVSNPSSTVNNIAVGQTISTTYNITLNGAIPENRSIPFIQTINTGFSTIKDTIKIVIGQDNSLITFEGNSWGDYDWVQGTYSWELTSQNTYAGNYCARSHTWASSGWGSNSGNNCNSELSITWTSTSDDSIIYYRNVSSEEDYDYFYFYIDNVEKEKISGTDNSWTRKAFFVPAGTHTFKFSYKKDYSAKDGSDCAWIDNIHLPVNGMTYTYILDSICQGGEYIFRDDTINTAGMEAGMHQFMDSTETGVYYLTLVLTQAPEVTIIGGDVTIRAGETVRLTAEGAESYIWSSGETSAIIDVYPTETTTYTVTGFNGSCSSTASTTITVDGSISIDAVNESTIRLYPNPANSTITIEGQNIIHVDILDLVGRKMTEREIKDISTSIDISMLNDGFYLLIVTDASGNKTIQKFVKK